VRVELIHNRHLLCGHILKRDQLKPRQLWASSSGADRTVMVDHIHGDWVGYSWIEDGEVKNHTKDWFAFQCRYCLVLPSNKIPEELK